MNAYVLVRYYSDGSGWDVVRVYLDKSRADNDLNLVKMDFGCSWKLCEVPYVDTYEKPLTDTVS